MTTSALAVPPGYDRDRQRVVGFVAASLDDQNARLGKAVQDLSVACLEWQPRPGHNTVGMLLAHVAITEVWWFLAAPARAPDRAGEERIVRDAIGLGLDDDGMPAAADGGHPAALRAWPASEYLARMARARERAHATLRAWDDASLASEVRFRDRAATRGWIAYHLLEHLATHAGQVGLRLHELRDAGLLPAG